MANRVLLEKEIKEYCSINNINDVSGFITQCILQGFNIYRYGINPSDNIKRENGKVETKPNNKERKKKDESVETEAKSVTKKVIKRTVKIINND